MSLDMGPTLSGWAGPSYSKTYRSCAAYAPGAGHPGSSAAGNSIAADESDQLALDANTISAIEPGFIGGIGCLQSDGVASTAQALQRCFGIVDQRNDNVAGVGRWYLLNHHRVAVENAGIDHRIAS